MTVAPGFFVIALCVFLSIAAPALSGPSDRLVASSELLARDEPSEPLNPNVANALKLQQSQKAHPSVANDTFYTVPLGTTQAPAGSLLKVETSTNTSLYSLPPNLSLSRFIYQSKTSNGTLVPVSGFILWPYASGPNSYGGYPVTVWSHGTSGSSAECAPSNFQNLWQDFQAPYQLALYGYVVVATDFAGLGVSHDAAGKAVIHEYTNRAAQSNDLFYSVPAARQAFPALSKEFVTIGHSQGAAAVWSLAEKLVSEPLAGYLGAVVLAPGTNLFDLPAGPAIRPLILLNLVPTLTQNYPDFKLENVFTPQGLQKVKIQRQIQGCAIVEQQLVGPGDLQPGWQNNSVIQKINQASVSGGSKFSGPMLIIQGGADPLVNPANTEARINDTLRKYPDSDIEFRLEPNVSHIPILYAGLRIYIDWIASRFAGEPVKPGYHSYTATVARPAATFQAETNWYIQKLM